MPTLNANPPAWQCFVRTQFLRDQQPKSIMELIGEEMPDIGQLDEDRPPRPPEDDLFEPCLVIGISSVPGRALGFHILTDRGAVFWRLPIHALAARRGAPWRTTVGELQLWDCFTEQISVHAFDRLDRMRCRVRMRDGGTSQGTYLFTVDWWGAGSAAEMPGDDGHKCAHIIELDEGNYAAQPNNRIYWSDPAFVTRPLAPGEKPGYVTNSRIWKCEVGGRWVTEESPDFFYDIGRGLKGLDSREAS